MKKLYFISGLAADRSVFENLDLSFCQPVFLDWIPPLKNERLEQYALRLAERIEEKDATIVGLSLGGMMASEIVKANPGMKAIIISSNRTRHELPAYTRFAIRYIQLYKLSTKFSMKVVFPITCWVLGAETREEKKRLWEMIDRRDVAFIKWSIGAVGGWKLTTPQPNVVHIHGTADRLLPYRLVKPDYTIENGNHLMIRLRAKEISALLKQLCCTTDVKDHNRL